MLHFELVLPCYNESRSLKRLLARVVNSAKEFGLDQKKFQLVLVENGSTDDSLKVMDELKATDLGDWFRIVQVENNQGYGYGLWSGLKTTEAKYVAWSHADEQCDPKDAFCGLKVLENNKVNKILVKGVRRKRDLKDVFISRIFEMFAKIILGLNCYEINAQPKVFPREILKDVEKPPKNFAFDLYVLYRARRVGFSYYSIPVDFPPRIHGVSNWANNFIGRYKTIFGMVCYMVTLAMEEGRV